MPIIQSRRRFMAGLAAGTAGLVAAPSLALAEPLPETTTVRLPKWVGGSYCWAGAYIAGEETALFNSIEGKRAEPRNKPPFPVTHGLFGKPTGINNVETLTSVLEILRIGSAAFAQVGTKESTGTRLFCLSGCIEQPGVYEVEHGVTLRDVLDLAGGVRGGRSLKAVLLGGAAGTFVGPDRLDIRLTFEDARAGGYTLGSGVVMARQLLK